MNNTYHLKRNNMKTHNRNYAVIFLILLIISVYTQNIVGQSNSVSHADKLLNNAIKEKQSIGIAAGVSVKGSLIWSNAAGYDNEKSKLLLKVTSPLRIASIVKPMTAVAILQMVEAGKLDLDAPVQDYLPNYPKSPKGTITTRHLLGHSSGIGAYKNGKERENRTNYPTLNDALQIFQNRELLNAPGTQFNYTSYGYVVLGRIIEQISGMSYDDYMHENIFKPAGMTSTFLEDSEQNKQELGAVYHRKGNGKIKEIKPTDLSDRIPAGGYRSTIGDILKFGEALIQNSLITQASFKIMMLDTGLKKEGNPYGLGLYLYGSNPELGNVIGHTGAQLGCSSFMMILPDSESVVVTIANTSGAGQEVANITTGLFQMIKDNYKK